MHIHEYMKLMENNYAIPGSSKNGYILVSFSLRISVEIVAQIKSI